MIAHFNISGQVEIMLITKDGKQDDMSSHGKEVRNNSHILQCYHSSFNCIENRNNELINNDDRFLVTKGEVDKTNFVCAHFNNSINFQ